MRWTNDKSLNELVEDISILVLLSAGLMAITKLFFNYIASYIPLNDFFLFLAWLFLILSILGIAQKIDLQIKGIVITGSTSAIFFILSWLIPNISIIIPLFK